MHIYMKATLLGFCGEAAVCLFFMHLFINLFNYLLDPEINHE